MSMKDRLGPLRHEAFWKQVESMAQNNLCDTKKSLFESLGLSTI